MAAVLLLLTSGAFADNSASRKIAALPLAPELQASGSARPTVAWIDFCQRVPSECNINLSEPEKIKLTRATWNTIKAINDRVNGSIISLSDQDHWGVADRWDLPNDGYGDCEDIQLLKRKLLTEQGLPRRAMRMTVLIDDRGEGHAVLMMRTDRGDFILDNKTNAILPWDKTGFTFSKREGTTAQHGCRSMGSLRRSPQPTGNIAGSQFGPLFPKRLSARRHKPSATLHYPSINPGCGMWWKAGKAPLQFDCS